MARERQAEMDAEFRHRSGESLLWIDLARLWRQHTGLPWVAAVWAVRPQALEREGFCAGQLIRDLNRSREAGQAHVEDLVREWTPRLAIPPETIRTYLTHNIHYALDAECMQAIRSFRRFSAELGVLPALPDLRVLEG